MSFICFPAAVKECCCLNKSTSLQDVTARPFFSLLVCVKKQNQQSNTALKYGAEGQRCDNETADKQRNVLLSTGEGLFMRRSLMEGGGNENVGIPSREGEGGSWPQGANLAERHSFLHLSSLGLDLGESLLGVLLFMRRGRALFAGH